MLYYTVKRVKIKTYLDILLGFNAIPTIPCVGLVIIEALLITVSGSEPLSMFLEGYMLLAGWNWFLTGSTYG